MSKRSSSLAFLCENYQSDNESGDDQPPKPCNKTKTDGTVPKLPLPDSIKELFITNSTEEVIDNPEQHDGRVRSFPHERGNWVTSVYALYDGFKKLHLISDNLIKNSQAVADFHKCDNFHISLSKTVVLRHHWIDLFVEDLKGRLRNLKRFYVDLDGLAIYVNDEGTRTFIALKVQLGRNELLRCIKLVDQSLLEFRLPTYYEDPAFHISLVWCVGNKKQELESLLPKLQINLNELNTAIQISPCHIDQISCKIGNRFYSFPLL